MFQPDLLKERVVLITGGGTGLGLSMATRLSSLGASVFLVGRREEVLERAAATLSHAGAACGFAAADVRDWNAVEKAVAAAEARFGRITTLINNAAGNFIARTETLSPNAFSSVVGIVLQGTFHCTLAVGRRWIAAGTPGTVLNIVTTYAESGSGFVVPSACAKSGVLAMTRSLAIEWARYGIRLNAVAPGPFKTEGAWSNLVPSSEDEARLVRAHPMKRLGRDDELANLVAYLASPYAAYINGECVTIDGGLHLRGSGFNHLTEWPDARWTGFEAARKASSQAGFMSAGSAPRRPDGEAVVRSGDRVLTRGALFERAARAASGLAATGLREAGTVAVLLRNDLPFLECMLASATAGAYCVPINWHYTTEEVAYILADTRPTHLVVHADLLHAVRASVPAGTTVLIVPTPPEISEAYGVHATSVGQLDGFETWDAWLQQWPQWKGSPAAMRGSMIYTSGTTGLPKAVKREPIPLEQREAYARLRAEWFGHVPGMRTAIIGPLYHSVQATYAYSALQVGGTVILVSKFDAESLLALIAKERLTHLHLVPTMMHRLVQLDESVRLRYDLSSLEYVIHGAAPCPPDVKRRLIDWWGPIVHEYYGTSETGMVTRSTSAEWLSRPGTVGRPCPGRVVRIYNDDGREAAAGTEGTIYMNLGMVPDFTYHGAEEKRAAAERDGLVTTGDVGYVDRDGFVFICDRRQDVVISGGVKIWPAEIEAVLATHASVADCAVFAIPDAEFGQVPAAVVQPVAGVAVTPEEIRQFLLARLARFKVPRHLEIRDSLSRDDSGKIFKRLLRDAFAGTADRG